MKTAITPRPTGNVYWANVPVEELGTQIHARFMEYQKECERRGYQSVWDHISSVYYGYDPGTDACSQWITESGKDGEFLNLHLNELASLLHSMLNLTTSDKLAIDAIPANDSPEADTQAALGKQIINFYQTDGKVEALLKQACERMFLFGTGYLTQLWDVYTGPEDGTEEVPVLDDSGEPLTETIEVEETVFDPLTGKTETRTETITRPVMEERVKRQGDLVHRVYGPMDIALDMGCRSHEDVRFFIVRERIDKFELAARFPEHRDHILSRPAFNADDLTWDSMFNATTAGTTTTDQIHVLRLLHDKTSTVQQGLEVLVCGEVVLLSSPLAYARLPIHAMVAQEAIGSPMGFSMVWNLLGPQTAMNAAATNGITSSDAGSVPKYAVAKKSNISVDAISTNMQVIYYDADPSLPNGGMPVMLATPQLQDVHLKQMDFWRSVMERFSGVNSVVRGESAGKSGADNALISSQATEYMSTFSRAYADCAKSVSLGIIQVLQRFATSRRLVSIVGSDEGPSMGWFTGEDISQIEQVVVDMGDPMLRTIQGKKAIADQMVEMFPKEFATPDQYLTFMATGRAEPLYKDARNRIRLINAENAKLSKGVVQPVLVSDKHDEHIREHLAILSSPSIRENDKIVGVVLSHVAEHMRQWRNMDSIMLVATGQTPPPPELGEQSPDLGKGGPPPQGSPGAPPGGPGPMSPPGNPGAPQPVPTGPDAIHGIKLPNVAQPPNVG